MVEQGSGKIVNIASRFLSGRHYRSCIYSFEIGVAGLTKAGERVGKSGVNVNDAQSYMKRTMQPRCVRTKHRPQILERIQRLGGEPMIGKAAVFLSSAASDYMPGIFGGCGGWMGVI